MVVPEGKGDRATVSAAELASALRRVALVVSEKEKCVRFNFSNNALAISSASPELGEAHETVPLDFKGSPLMVGFNSRFVLDIVNSHNQVEKLSAELHGTSGPGVFLNPADPSSLAVVIPMRLQS